VAVVNVHVPPLRVHVPPLIGVPPSSKVTVPVGLAPVTVTVNVTGFPEVEGLRPLVSVVVVAAWTTWVTALDVLGRLFASPA